MFSCLLLPLVSLSLVTASRSLQELSKTREILQGVESQRLRSFCTSECMQPGRDLDDYGRLLAQGDLRRVKEEFDGRVERLSKTLVSDGSGASSSSSPPSASAAAAQELYSMRWGPTSVPIFSLLGQLRMLIPSQRDSFLEIARFLSLTAKVPVDAPDLSGTPALSQSFSTKPAVDFDYAQVLCDAGGDVNVRNRYGGTVAHEIIQIWTPQDKNLVKTATDAMRFFFAQGGSVDIADGDGMTVRYMIGRLGRFVPEITKLLDGVDRQRNKKRQEGKCCVFCAREESTLLMCGRCKKAKYCSPSQRGCQKYDWSRHKKECKAPGTSSVSFG